MNASSESGLCAMTTFIVTPSTPEATPDGGCTPHLEETVASDQWPPTGRIAAPADRCYQTRPSVYLQRIARNSILHGVVPPG